MAGIKFAQLITVTNEERIRKLRNEVQSLRDLLDKTRSRRKTEKPAEEKPEKDTKPKRAAVNPKPRSKKEDDIPPF